jgi:HSP20 family protein
MNLVRWNSTNDFSALQNQMNRFFQDALNSWPLEAPGTGTWSPVADVCETDDHLIVRAELPGVDPKMVDLRLEKNVLTIRGKREFEPKNQKESYHRIERSYGMFLRTFTLPVSVDSSKIHAAFKDGVLEVTLPKSETAKPRRIEIAAATA